MRFLASVLLFLTVGFNSVCAAPINGDYPKAPGISPSEARQRVIEAGKKYIGTPYVYAGLSNRGLDCSGFVYVSFNDALGVTLPRATTALHSYVETISINNAQPGDLVFFRTGNTRAITHVGLYVGDRNFLHAASAGSKTGVIYSNLDEQYYVNTYASAGRVLPPASGSSPTRSGTGGGSNRTKQQSPQRTSAASNKVQFQAGAAIAVNWDFAQASGNALRGFTSQISLGADFAPALSFALELRPEYDDALEVFRLPITLSWEPHKMLRIFAGAALNAGDAGFTYGKDENGDPKRMEYNRTAWLGTAGVTFTPFTIPISNHELTPYLEGALYMSYKNSEAARPDADFYANTRFSTGLRWRVNL